MIKTRKLESKLGVLIFQQWHGLKITAQKMKFSIKDFISKWDQFRSFLRIWSHLLKKSLMEYLIFCAVNVLILFLFQIWIIYHKGINFYKSHFSRENFFWEHFFFFLRELIFPKKPTSHNLRQLNLANFARKLFPVTFCMRLKKGV